jgi:hypothetical protein
MRHVIRICLLKPDVHHNNIFCFKFEDETLKSFQGNKPCFLWGTCETNNFMKIHCSKMNQQYTIHYFISHVQSDMSLFYSDIVSDQFNKS